jgi:magnesium transporter
MPDHPLRESSSAAGSYVISTAWLHLHEPSEDTLWQLARDLGLPRLAVEDAVKAGQRVKYETYEGVAFLVLKPLRYDDDTKQIETDQMMIFIGGSWVVSVTYGPDHDAPIARKRLDKAARLRGNGPGAIVYALTDSIVDDYLVILTAIQGDLTELERAVFAPRRADHTEALYTLKREILEFQAAAAPVVTVIEMLVRDHGEHPHLANALRDVADHATRVSDGIRSTDELVNSAMDANASRLSIRQNEDMRRISAWAAILAVPTLVAGVYGMNFQHMPELGWWVGYPGAILLMAVVSFVLYRSFRKRGWL